MGLTLVYGLLRILHVAHAGLYTLGGYFGVLVFNSTGSLMLSGIVAMFGVGILGVIIYRLCYEAILDQPPLCPFDCLNRSVHCDGGIVPDTFRFIRHILH